MHRLKLTDSGSPQRRSRQRGVFLLEALVAILIIAFGVLGSVGLLARSVQNVDDAKYRGEAAYLANALIGQMWVADRTPANLDANFSKLAAGPGYTEFAAVVGQRLPNTAAIPPDVVFGPGPTATSSTVIITISWRPPGEPAPAPPHVHMASATIGSN